MTTNSTISHEIAELLRTEILQQRYRCGDRLPSERDLATRFDASRGAVREGLSQLEQLGLIQILPGGARVQAIDAASIAILGPLMAMDEVPDGPLVDQFLETFSALTALTARSAVEKADAEQMKSLQTMVVSLSEHCGDFAAMQPQWREFLELMVSVADNLVVRLISNDLKAQFVEQMLKLEIKPRFDSAEIERFLEALQLGLAEKNGEAVAAAIQTHFDGIRLAVGDALAMRVDGFRKQAM